MHMLYHRQLRKVIQALAGRKDPRSMEVYTRVFALDMAATLAVPFTADGRDAAEILRSCHRPAEIVGQAAGALPLSEGDKDKRIPDEAESVSRFESLTLPAAEALRLSSMTRASFRPGLREIFIPHPVSLTFSLHHDIIRIKEPRSSGDQLTSSYRRQ